MRPRFVVSKVSGYPITPGAAASSRIPRTIWSVLDSANRYLPVNGPVTYSRFGARGEQAMRALAAELNAEQAWRLGQVGR